MAYFSQIEFSSDVESIKLKAVIRARKYRPELIMASIIAVLTLIIIICVYPFYALARPVNGASQFIVPKYGVSANGFASAARGWNSWGIQVGAVTFPLIGSDGFASRQGMML
jgi:hypothetical protein